MFSFFRRPKEPAISSYRAPLVPVLNAVRDKTLTLQGFQQKLWQSVPSVTIPLEYRGDHRVPFVVHAEPWLKELGKQRLSRPIFKVCDAPSPLHAVDMLEGIITSITPLSILLQDMRDSLIPIVPAKATTEDLLQLEMRALTARFLTGGPLSLCHLGLSTITSLDSMPNIMFNRLSTVRGQHTLAPSEPEGVMLAQLLQGLLEKNGLLLVALDRLLADVPQLQ